MAHRGMKFGIFLAPLHRVGENPTLALNRDMELIEWLDYLGYDEVWIGEHHSAGWELIASPEIFIGAAGARSTSCSARGCRCTWRRYLEGYGVGVVIERTCARPGRDQGVT